MLKCKLCNFETDKQIKLSKHTYFQHKLRFPEYLIKIKYKGIKPTCGCGCNKETKYEPGLADFHKYIQGHHSRVIKNMFGDPKNPKRVAKISATRKAKFKSGEYKHIIDSIKDKDWVECGKKISKSNKGIPKPRPKGFGIGRIHSKETREKMSKSAIKNLLKTGKVKRSNLEIAFEIFFQSLNIEYKHSFIIKGSDKVSIFDFYLPKYNTIIEVDGDFFHSNPIKYPDGPVFKTQIKNQQNDKIKNELAKQHGYKLLRFWESDINNNPKLITKILKEELNIK